MKTAKGDITLHIGKVPAICITTNGFVKKNKENVMGRGIAKQISSLYPEIPGILGRLIARNGNIVQVIKNINGTDIISFPVKPQYSSDHTKAVAHMKNRVSSEKIPGWAVIADIDIIVRSAKQLNDLIDSEGYSMVLLPRPGCGAGELNWSEVKESIKDILRDNIIVCTF